MADAIADRLRGELRAALAANTGRLRDAIRAELGRGIVLEPGRRMQFEVDPFSYDIACCASEESVLVDWLDDSLPADWYERAEQVLGGWGALVWEELCPWFAERWREADGPGRYSPAFLFFHGYHNDQYDLRVGRWLSGPELEVAWGEPDV